LFEFGGYVGLNLLDLRGGIVEERRGAVGSLEVRCIFREMRKDTNIDCEDRVLIRDLARGGGAVDRLGKVENSCCSRLAGITNFSEQAVRSMLLSRYLLSFRHVTRCLYASALLPRT
jgi:hypothetical protein